MDPRGDEILLMQLANKRFLFPASVILLFTLASLAACELVLRLLGLGFGHAPLVSDPILHHAHPRNYTFVAHIPSGEYGGHVVRYDGEGYVTDPDHRPRPEKARGVYRAAFMGDSFVEALQVSYADSFVGRLADYGSGQTVVRNFGVSSYSPIFYVLQWRQVAERFKPTRVFVLLFSNDPGTDRYMAKQGTYSRGALQALPGPGRGWLTSQLRRLYVARLFRRTQLKLQWIAQHADEDLSRTVGGYVEENPDITEPTTGSLKELQLGAERNEAQLVLLAVPSKYRIVNEGMLDQNEKGPEFSEKVGVWAKANGIQFLDLVVPFQRATRDGISCFLEEGHFTSAGHQVVADAIRAYFPALFGEEMRKHLSM